MFLYPYISLVQKMTRPLQFNIMVYTVLVIYLQPTIQIAIWKCLWIDKTIRWKGTFSLKHCLGQQPYHILKGAALLLNFKRDCYGVCNPHIGQETIIMLPGVLHFLYPLYHSLQIYFHTTVKTCFTH